MTRLLTTLLLFSLILACERQSAPGYAERWFSEMPLKIADYHLFDIGVVDLDGDNILDFYTSNHFGIPGIHLGDGYGRFGTNVVSQYHLGHDRNFPGLEDLLTSPRMSKPGFTFIGAHPKSS